MGGGAGRRAGKGVGELGWECVWEPGTCSFQGSGVHGQQARGQHTPATLLPPLLLVGTSLNWEGS